MCPSFILSWAGVALYKTIVFQCSQRSSVRAQNNGVGKIKEASRWAFHCQLPSGGISICLKVMGGSTLSQGQANIDFLNFRLEYFIAWRKQDHTSFVYNSTVTSWCPCKWSNPPGGRPDIPTVGNCTVIEMTTLPLQYWAKASSLKNRSPAQHCCWAILHKRIIIKIHPPPNI